MPGKYNWQIEIQGKQMAPAQHLCDVCEVSQAYNIAYELGSGHEPYTHFNKSDMLPWHNKTKTIAREASCVSKISQ